jgi:formamidase
MRVQPGELVALQIYDGFDGQFTRESTHGDVLSADLTRSHPLSGPIWVEGAELGDIVEIELAGFEVEPFGVTAIIPTVGLLSEHFPEPYLLKWEIADGYARSDDLPGVAVPSAPFAGVIGVAPSQALLEEWHRREGSSGDSVITIPPRENGGNIDIPHLTAGSQLCLPVLQPGALVSVGDLHFAQGEGELCGTAIEVAGTASLRFGLVKQPEWLPVSPVYSSPARPGRPTFATTGMSIGSDVHDVYRAAQNAVLDMIEYLTSRHGLRREAAYALAGATVDLRVSELVNAPHCLVSALLPLDVFERQPDRHFHA